MSGYNFLRESELHIVHGGNRYNVKITPALSFTQTFAEDAYQVKTLHDQTKMFQGTKITKANPANFSFETHLTTEKDESIVLDLLTDYDTSSGEQLLKSFDMFIVTGGSTFKLEGCVITTGDISFEKARPLTLSVSGQAQKLSRVGDESFSLPGTLQSASATRTPTKPLLDVTVGGNTIPHLFSTTLSVQNNIQWTPYETLQAGLNVNNTVNNAMYPSNYSLDNRVLSGNITQFSADANLQGGPRAANFNTFNESTTVRIKTIVNGSDFFDANITGVMFTKRQDVGEVYSQTLDFRMATSPSDLGTIITY
mgnify:FL=1|tara:strand:+ start:1298 stop:2227 length:930 start_codon:yes stop_codon:yes gene_type:complete